jgi:hypothetical protein
MKRQIQENTEKRREPEDVGTSEKNLVYDQSLPLIRILERSPFGIKTTALSFGILLYIIYVVIGISTESIDVTFFSFMHILQISFSICVFVGFISLHIFYRRFTDIMNRSRFFLDIENHEYSRFAFRIKKDFESRKSILVAIPLIFVSSIFFISGVGPNIPDSNFPVSSNSVLFIFITITEFSFLMLYLLGAVGFWFAICLIRAYYLISAEFKMRIPPLERKPLKELSSFLGLTSFLLAITETTVLPTLLYVLIFYSSIEYALYLGSLGLSAVVLFIIMLFFVPQYFLHRSIVDAKERRLTIIQKEYSEHETELFEMLDSLENAETENKYMKKSEQISELANLNSYLIYAYDEADRISGWMFDAESLVKLVASVLIPVIAFLLQIYVTVNR